MKKTTSLLVLLMWTIMIVSSVLLLWQTTFPSNASTQTSKRSERQKSAKSTSKSEIYELTKESVVIAYVKQHRRLPDYYVTKNKARQLGWDASKGNLCDVLPRRAIGGDRFGNREGKLPNGKTYYEADVNYSCGRRGSDRLIFTRQGEVWVTHDHYKTFIKK